MPSEGRQYNPSNQRENSQIAEGLRVNGGKLPVEIVGRSDLLLHLFK